MEAIAPPEHDTKPIELKPAARSRLRKLFAYGRPVHLSELTGMELDLIANGLLRSCSGGLSASAVVEVTPRGIAALAEHRTTQREALRGHSTLANRLAHSLRAKGLLTWENIALYNPVRTYPRAWDMARPDVYACTGGLRADLAKPVIYEVKVSKSDFRAELAKPEKLAAYRDLAEAVYFCCPANLIAAADLPDGVGLIYETEPGEFTQVQRARRRKDFSFHADVLMTLLVKRQHIELDVQD